MRKNTKKPSLNYAKRTQSPKPQNQPNPLPQKDLQRLSPPRNPEKQTQFKPNQTQSPRPNRQNKPNPNPIKPNPPSSKLPTYPKPTTRNPLQVARYSTSPRVPRPSSLISHPNPHPASPKKQEKSREHPAQTGYHCRRARLNHVNTRPKPAIIAAVPGSKPRAHADGVANGNGNGDGNGDGNANGNGNGDGNANEDE